jgi:tetratricopeptide (TPR) repeat protein
MARKQPESLRDFVSQRIVHRFGFKGILALAVVSAAFFSWLNWPSIRELPGISHLVGLASRQSIPQADPRRFSVAVARLDNDPSREHERLIIRLLSDLDGVQIIHIDRTISAGSAIPEEGLRRGRMAAREYLRESNASVLIWGSVLTLGGQSRLDLNLTTTSGASAERRQYTPEAAQEFRLPQVFWSDLSQVLQLLILSTSARFEEVDGQSQAPELTLFISRVRNLLRSRSAQLRWNPEALNRTRLILADALWRLARETGDDRAYREAIALNEGALGRISRTSEPREWARFQSTLGALYAELGEGRSGTSEFAKAIASLNLALEVYTLERDPEDWAWAQVVRANTLLTLAERSRDIGQIDGAMEGYRLSLRVYNRRDDPRNWANIQNSMGTGLLARGERNRSRGLVDFAAAARCFRGALEIRTRSSNPREWGQTTLNLGITLLQAGARTENERMTRGAIAAFQDLSQVYSRSSYPMAWANVKNSLGNALSNLGTWRRDTALLDQAVAAYTAALEVRTRDAWPHYWASTQYNLGNALFSLGEIRGDREQMARGAAALRASHRVWREIGDDYRASLAANAFTEAQARLREDRER